MITLPQRGSDWCKPDAQLFQVLEAKLSLGDQSDGRGEPGTFFFFKHVFFSLKAERL